MIGNVILAREWISAAWKKILEQEELQHQYPQWLVSQYPEWNSTSEK